MKHSPANSLMIGMLSRGKMYYLNQRSVSQSNLELLNLKHYQILLLVTIELVMKIKGLRSNHGPMLDLKTQELYWRKLELYLWETTFLQILMEMKQK